MLQRGGGHGHKIHLELGLGCSTSTADNSLYKGCHTKETRETLDLGVEDKASLGFLALGDWGMPPGQQNIQFSVARAMDDVAKKNPTHFIISTGDNLYSHDIRTFKSTWKDVYNRNHTEHLTWYLAVGNHDRGRPGVPTYQQQLEYSKHETRWVMPSIYYYFTKEFDHNSILFVVLDSTQYIYEPQHRSSQLEFLQDTLANNQADYIFVIAHHPIYSTGYYHGEPVLREDWMPILNKYGVDIYLSGHDHNLQHLKNTSMDHVDHVISGAGGGLLYQHRHNNAEIVRTLGVEPLFFMHRAGFTYFNINAHRIKCEHYGFDQDDEYKTVATKLYSFVRGRKCPH